MFEHSGRRHFFRRAHALVRSLRIRWWPKQAETDASVADAFTRRALVMGAMQAGLFGFLGFRLHDMQVTYSRRYRLLADENRFFLQPIAPRRGNIRDRNRLLLAESIENLQVTLIPDLAGDLDAALLRLGQIVQINEEDRQRVLESLGKQSRVLPVLVRGDLTWAEFSRISLLAPEMPGIEASIGWTRAYQRSAEVGHVVGYVGKGDRSEIDREPLLRLASQRIGKVGVELGMEAALRGTPGSVKREVDARGRIVRELDREPAIAGRNLDLSIDTEFQAWLLRRMSAEDWSAVVALDARNGEIIAMGSTPSYDPAVFMNGISTAGLQALYRQPGNPLLNKAVRGLYPPGSTYKIVTALAGLESGVMTKDTVVNCPGSVTFGGQKFRCWKSGGHGNVRLHRALSESCDCYFYETARRLGIDRLAEAGKALGFGAVHDLGVAPEKGGVVPDPAWKSQAFLRPWLGGETLMAGIGQGYVLTTPMQLALMTARVASGLALKPVLVRDTARAPFAKLPFSDEHLALVRSGMEAVVNDDNGTGKRAALASVRVAGKTGTAQVARISTEVANADLPRAQRDHSLFVGYAPAEAPAYAVAAIVEHGGNGGLTAAPLVRDVLAALIERDPARSGQVFGTGDNGPHQQRLQASEG